ncbi:MAG: 30S ribosomal protein S8e [Candidatus Heimdallarchaeota archaeon]|nr:30S ribosomal protein S8e [Candidatus Heimdallarchaeota archaeon]MBY8995483.1 30S ribosomal protein S8e [Candidatus Heimdallarchaeota archaeon]
MARWQGLSRRTKSGSRLKKHHEKRKAELGRPEAQTIIGEPRVKKIRTRGGNEKFRAYRLDYCNLSDPNTGKSEKVRILDVESNPSNKEYTRRKVMTKGALIRTEKGYAIITNRPGQEGFISAIPTQIDVDATQQRTISAKKKKRQTLQRKRVGSTSGTQKKTTTKKPELKPATKPKVEAPKKEAPAKKPATPKPKTEAAADEVPTVTVDKEIVVAYKGKNYKFDKKITIKDLKEKKAPKIVKDKVAEAREFKSWS